MCSYGMGDISCLVGKSKRSPSDKPGEGSAIPSLEQRRASLERAGLASWQQPAAAGSPASAAAPSPLSRIAPGVGTDLDAPATFSRTGTNTRSASVKIAPLTCEVCKKTVHAAAAVLRFLPSPCVLPL
eukprot:m.100170 g.100170  ORF g.100170 m.100170 type:complete len:128 (+) comp51458_c0_seq12:1150-1533(+)